ncbi:ABC transporter ATP-binding protein [Castellaniella defragrans]|uniref:ABC transporter ATP-binding protein n=1 Tax=Castellaniella defragrans TaxID=75697 RepID=UPI0023F10D5B|nr:ABC transporter ATP-binding protein [Castellaniella defragrans]
MNAQLELRRLARSFGRLQVLEDISFSLPAGEVLGIIGPNGAGKTTLFNLIAGDLAPDNGQILFEGEDITRLSAARRCLRGIGRTYQIPHPFAGMTVYENVLVGASFGAGRSEREARAPARDALERTGLLDKANRLAGSLPLLDRKRLELARALATDPKVLLLDEIAGGLSDPEVTELLRMIGAIRRTGISMIWIEHIVHALMAVADHLLVLDAGLVLTQGRPQAVMADPRVQEVYLGMALE